MERLALGNAEFEGRNAVYVHRAGDEIAMIDTGIATDDARADLTAQLRARDIDPGAIDTILLTHWHQDHTGLAGELQRQSGATVYAHRLDVPLVGGDAPGMAAYERRQREAFERWGMPREARRELREFFEANTAKAGDPVDVTPIDDGDRIDVGDLAITTHHAPGHTAGSCLYVPSGDGVAFVGDAVLPVYTPNIGGADVRVDRPLATYLETLRSIAEAGYDRLLPGHRDPIEAPRDRVETIIAHHRTRTRRVLEVLDRIGPADAWTVSAELFGALEGVHIMHGPGEAAAHLDHLADAGVLEVSAGTYALADAGPIEPMVSAAWP
ncbi:MAG: MBL fold metallo-hydrolase [Halobacteriota archaeon]